MGVGAAVAVGLSAVSGSRQAKAQGKASVADIRQQGLATGKNIESRAEGVLFKQGVVENQIRDMEQVLQGKMTQNGMAALQTEARLRAASAETGASGSTQEVLETAFVQENLNNAALVRDSQVMQNQAKMGMVADILNFKHGKDALLFAQPSPESAGYRAGAQAQQSFSSGFNSTYQLLGGLGGGSSVTGSNPSVGSTTGFENLF